jgi:hypothetical protein
MGSSPTAGVRITVVVGVGDEPDVGGVNVIGGRPNSTSEAALTAVAERVQIELRAAGFPDPLLPAGMDLAVVGSSR